MHACLQWFLAPNPAGAKYLTPAEREFLQQRQTKLTEAAPLAEPLLQPIWGEHFPDVPDLHQGMCGCGVCCCKLQWLAAAGWVQPLCQTPLLLWCCFSCVAVHDADCMRDWRVWLLGLVWVLTETSIYGILFYCPLLIQSLLSKNEADTTESWLWRHEGLSLRSLRCSLYMPCLMAATATAIPAESGSAEEASRLALLSAVVFAPAAVGMAAVGKLSQRANEQRWHGFTVLVLGGVSLMWVLQRCPLPHVSTVLPHGRDHCCRPCWLLLQVNVARNHLSWLCGRFLVAYMCSYIHLVNSW